MFSFVLIIFQLLFLIMIGAFYRSSTYTSTNSQQITLGLVTILGFVLMSSTYRKLTLFSLLLLLFVSFLTIELNFLFVTFWGQCFTSFTNTVNVANYLLNSSLYAALAVVITCLDFFGLFEYWQIFAIISLTMTIGFGLSSSLIIYGLDTFDGGFGSATFLFCGVSSLMIWMLSIRGKISVLEHKMSESYINYTLGFIGVAITFFSWPVLNIGGSSISQLNTSLSSSSSLNGSAYINTLTALSVPLLISTFLSSNQTQSQKFHPRIYIQSFINAGIVISCFDDISLHPVIGMIMASISTIITLVINKYLVKKTDVKNQSDFKMVLMKFSKIIFRILWSFISVSIGAIVVKTRSSAELGLLSEQSAYGTKAGLMVAGWVVVLFIGAIFGVISAVSINFYINYRLSANVLQKITKITDELFFDEFQSEIFPIYRDIIEFESDKTYQQDLTRRVLHETLLHQHQFAPNIYQTNKKPSNHDTQSSGKIQKQTLVIKNDFSQQNIKILDKSNINLSSMKVIQRLEEPIAQQIQNDNRVPEFKKSVINPVRIGDTPIRILQANSKHYESNLPAESQVDKPNQLKPNPSNSKLSNIYVIQLESHEKKSQNPIKKLIFDDKIVQNEDCCLGINRANS